MPPAPGVPGTESELKIRGCADASVHHFYDEGDSDLGKLTPYAVYGRRFNNKSQFYGYAGGVNHIRNPRYVRKRKAEWGNNIDPSKEASALRSGSRRT
jgi:hypothetical protein